MSETRFHKGELVRFRLGVRTVTGTVKEDIGPIGVKGRRLYSIEFRAQAHSDELSRIELPAVQIQRVEDAVAAE